MKGMRTVYNEATCESLISKSRFIAYVKPVESESEAVVYIEQIKKRHWDAAHHVPVYVIGEQFSVQRYSDDGEPSGTAGVPILDLIKKEGLTNIVCVVVRYFGGIKLGTGGLVRAYTQSAKQAIESALIVEKRPFLTMRCTYDYTLHGKVQNALINDESVIIKSSEFFEQVSTEVYINPESMDQFSTHIIEVTAAQINLQKGDEVYITIREGMVMKGES